MDKLESLRQENDMLRGLLGNSAKPCPYCGLAAEDWAKCQFGFPGCSRADDAMLSKHFADAYRAECAEKELLDAQARISAAIKLTRRHDSSMSEIREALLPKEAQDEVDGSL